MNFTCSWNSWLLYFSDFRSPRAFQAALNCIRKTTSNLQLSKPRVVIVSDTPSFVKSTIPNIREFAEVIHFIYPVIWLLVAFVLLWYSFCSFFPRRVFLQLSPLMQNNMHIPFFPDQLKAVATITILCPQTCYWRIQFSRLLYPHLVVEMMIYWKDFFGSHWQVGPMNCFSHGINLGFGQFCKVINKLHLKNGLVQWIIEWQSGLKCNLLCILLIQGYSTIVYLLDEGCPHRANISRTVLWIIKMCKQTRKRKII